MAKATQATPSERVRRLERKVIRFALLRYKAWLDENPSGLWPKEHAAANKKRWAWEMTAAAKALYEAKHK